MHPILFTIGPITISSYGVMAALGLLAGLVIIKYNRKFANLSDDDASSLILLSIVSGVLGARIFYVVQFFDEKFRHNLIGMIRIDEGGLVFYGGFILSFFTLLLFCYKKKLDTIRVLDVMVPSLTIGHAFGRIGCLFSGCCYGKETDLFWGIVYPKYSEPFAKYGAVPLHPTQLYETFFNIILCVITMILLRKSKRGVTFGFYLIAYGLLRFLNECVRGDHDLHGNSFTIAQYIGFGILPLGIIYLTYFLCKKDKKENA